MTVSEETGLELALASHLNVLMLKQLRNCLIAIDKLDDSIEGFRRNPDANVIAMSVIKMMDEIRVQMDRYDGILGDITDNDPEKKQRILEELKGHDVLMKLELIVRMTAGEKLAQLDFRNKNNG